MRRAEAATIAIMVGGDKKVFDDALPVLQSFSANVIHMGGLGSGTVGPLAYVLIARAFPPERQPSMFALMSTGWLLPSLFAPAVSGWIVSAFGWRWVFLGIIPIAVVVASLAVIPMRAYRSMGEPTASRVPSAVRLAVGVGATAIALQSGSLWVAGAAFVVGVALAVSGGRQLFPRGLPRATTGLPAVLAVRVLATAAFLGVDSFVPLAADRVHDAADGVGVHALLADDLAHVFGRDDELEHAGMRPFHLRAGHLFRLVHDRFDDGQSQAEVPLGAGPRLVGPVEPLDRLQDLARGGDDGADGDGADLHAYRTGPGVLSGHGGVGPGAALDELGQRSAAGGR